MEPVFDGWVFESLVDGYAPLAINLWTELFDVFELTVVMRQQEDKSFAELLNRLREGLQTKSDIDELKSRSTNLH